MFAASSWPMRTYASKRDDPNGVGWGIGVGEAVGLGLGVDVAGARVGFGVCVAVGTLAVSVAPSSTATFVSNAGQSGAGVLVATLTHDVHSRAARTTPSTGNDVAVDRDRFILFHR